VPWFTLYRRPEEHDKVSPAELEYITADRAEPTANVSWSSLLRYRQMWAIVIAKFLTDPIWWVFLYWLPKFFSTQFGLKLTDLGWPLVIIYTMSMGGSIAGGWLPARLLRAHWSVNRARKTAMLVCALAVVPIIKAATAGQLWLAVALLGVATAAHQGWSANLYTVASDLFPKRAVASAVGIGGFGGAVGGMVIATFTGFILQFTGSYAPVFVIAACAYLVALLLLQLLVPRIEPLTIEEE
jgi:ACS family hexuronate transporter-like MFS transporter